jgi:U32 family peptidase
MTELLAPAGNFECLTAAIKAGADAIYFGVSKLNMRSLGAKNFEIQQIKKVVQICHENNVKAYLALNTIIYENEITKLKTILKKAKEAKIDAIIASDFSVIEEANKLNIPIHLSTQMSISNSHALNFLKRKIKNLKRVVLARELSLEQIKKIKKQTKVELEAFCHGAMCISVSGRCFLSQFLHNKSANRGECLQTCRRSYVIKDIEENHELKLEPNFVLSPKDLCTIPLLDKIVKVADCIKIEGRARPPEYVYTVTKTYKTALELIKNKKYTEKNKKELIKAIKCVYNRGFSTGFYLGKPLDEWSNSYGSRATKKKTYIGVVKNYYPKVNVAEIKLETQGLKLKDTILITGATTYVEQNIEEMQIEHKSVKEVKKQQSVGLKVKEKVRKNDKVFLIN